MALIFLDAGHGGYDNGSQYQGRREKDDNLNMVLAVGEILSQNGVDVGYTRVTDVYDSPIRKAQIANEAGADLFVSIHRNSSAEPNTYQGVQTLLFNDEGIKVEIANAINNNLEQVGYKNLGISFRRDLAVLRRTRMPAILVEVGFINSDADNYLFDNSFDETAYAIANGIYQVIYGSMLPGMAQEELLYPVKEGFASKEGAALKEGYLVKDGARENTAVNESDMTLKTQAVKAAEQREAPAAVRAVMPGNLSEPVSGCIPPAMPGIMPDDIPWNMAGMQNPGSIGFMPIGTVPCNGNYTGKRYQVQVGLFRNYQYAINLANQIRMMGLPVQIVPYEQYHAVRVGNNLTYYQGRALESKLSKLGFDTLLVQV